MVGFFDEELVGETKSRDGLSYFVIGGCVLGISIDIEEKEVIFEELCHEHYTLSLPKKEAIQALRDAIKFIERHV